MAFDNSYTAVTGATYSAADYNTYTKANFTAIWVGTTAGDMEYYTSSTAKARLAIGTSGGILYSTGSAPAWSSVGAAGAILYTPGSSAPAWLAFGSAHTFVKSEGGSAPIYGALVYKRQGGSSTNWEGSGSTTYTPTKTLIQVGSKSVSYTVTGSAVVTFPTAFSERPVIFVTANNNGGDVICDYSDNSTTGFTIRVTSNGSGSGTADVNWLAIGA